MTELELLRAFFVAWEGLASLPRNLGRPSLERKAAEDLVAMRAQAVRNARKHTAPVVNTSLQALRGFQKEVAEIQPQDTRRGSKTGAMDITNG